MLLGVTYFLFFFLLILYFLNLQQLPLLVLPNWSFTTHNYDNLWQNCVNIKLCTYYFPSDGTCGHLRHTRNVFIEGWNVSVFLSTYRLGARVCRFGNSTWEGMTEICDKSVPKFTLAKKKSIILIKKTMLKILCFLWTPLSEIIATLLMKLIWDLRNDFRNKNIIV